MACPWVPSPKFKLGSFIQVGSFIQDFMGYVYRTKPIFFVGVCPTKIKTFKRYRLIIGFSAVSIIPFIVFQLAITLIDRKQNEKQR